MVKFNIFNRALTLVVSERLNSCHFKGFKEVKSACCGSGLYRGVYSCGGKRGIEKYEVCDNVEEYLFFDSYHPNERGHLVLAKQFWDGPPSIRGPFSLRSFF